MTLAPGESSSVLRISPSAPAEGGFAAFKSAADRARSMQLAGHAEEAMRLADMARQALDGIDVQETYEAAEALNYLGVTYFQQGYYTLAKPIFEQGLAIADKLNPPDVEILASLLGNLGNVEGRIGPLKAARELLERSVKLCEQYGPGSRVLAMALDSLGHVCLRAGDLDRAAELHQQAFDIFRRLSGPFDNSAAIALGNLSSVYMKRGEIELAETYRLRAFDAHLRSLGLDHPETQIDLANLVELALIRRDEARVGQLLTMLLSIGGPAPQRQHRSLAETLDALTHTAFGLFRLDLAERTGTRAVELLSALDGPAAPSTLAARHLLANVHRATGDLESAARDYRMVIDGFRAAGMRSEAVGAMVDFAKVWLDRGANEAATNLLQSAADELRKPDAACAPRTLASVVGNLGLACYVSGEYERADANFIEALDALSGDPENVERPWILHNRALLLYHLGRNAEARPLYEEAKARWTSLHGPDHPFVLAATENLALVHWSEGNVELALAAFSEVASDREVELRRVLAVGSERKRLAFAQNRQHDLHKAVSFALDASCQSDGAARLAAELTLQQKGRVLDAMSTTAAAAHGDADPETRALIDKLNSIRTEIASLLSPGSRASDVPDPSHRAHLRALEEQTEAQLSYRSALRGPTILGVTLSAVQQAIPEDAVLVEFVRFRSFDPRRTGKHDAFGPERYAAFTLGRIGDPCWVDLGPCVKIDTKVDLLRRSLRSRSTPIAEVETSAAALYELVLQPFEHSLAAARHVLIAPDGKLALVPFGVLRLARGERIGERALVSFVTCGRELLGCEEPSCSKDIVVVSAPDFESNTQDEQTFPPGAPNPLADRGSFEPLPGAEAEGEYLETLLENVTHLPGAKATASAVRNVQRPAVLHIATHGFFAPREDTHTTHLVTFLPLDQLTVVRETETKPAPSPMFFSGIALAGANRGPGCGILTAQEMAGMDLRGTRLVVLSACETGLGSVKSGQEFTGLRRAIAIAGASAQITSLWRINDLASGVLMEHLYRLLLEGRGRAEALTLAQARVAADPQHPEWAHPYYWAAFVLSGAWGPMRDALVARGDGLSADVKIAERGIA